MSGQTIADYIAASPPEVRPVLEEVLSTIRRVAPHAEESISYQIPTFKVDGKALVYFAGWKHHVGLYPVPTLDPRLEEEVAPFREGKNTLRFPFTEPIRYDLIERVVSTLVERRRSGGT